MCILFFIYFFVYKDAIMFKVVFCFAYSPKLFFCFGLFHFIIVIQKMNFIYR